MKVAVIGSRNLKIKSFGKYIPKDATEIVSGGENQIDTYAKKYALRFRLKLTEITPEYEKYGKQASMIRNNLIINYSDRVIAFWDGRSNGTECLIEKCRKINKRTTVYIFNEYDDEECIKFDFGGII